MKMKIIEGVGLSGVSSFRARLFDILSGLKAGDCLELALEGKTVLNVRNQVFEVVTALRAATPGFTVATRKVDTPDGPALRVWRLENKPTI